MAPLYIKVDDILSYNKWRKKKHEFLQEKKVLPEDSWKYSLMTLWRATQGFTKIIEEVFLLESSDQLCSFYGPFLQT